MFRNPFRKDAGDGFEDWLVSPRGPIRRQGVPPEEAFARWQAHRDAFEETGLWPVIVPVEHADNLEAIFAEQAEGVDDDVALGLNLDVQDVFGGRLEERMTDEAEYPDEDAEHRTDLDFDPEGLVRQKKPSVERQIAATGDLLKFNGSKSGIWVVLVPCREPWEVPAVLGYGGWNDCPMPAEHVAVFREWHARHGAVPLVIGSDTVELLVRPVESPIEAKRVAIEQFAYCPDIVDQGVGTVEALASGLLDASVWFFWWD